MHSNLNHLTWQAKQVAKGDYSQTVSFLGEFSEAFNTMTRQLKEREESLKREAEREKTHANMMESYNQLLMELIARSDEEVMVISMIGQKVLYSNENMSIQISPEEIYQLCLQQQEKQDGSMFAKSDTYEWTVGDRGQPASLLQDHHRNHALAGPEGLCAYYPRGDRREAAPEQAGD